MKKKKTMLQPQRCCSSQTVFFLKQRFFVLQPIEVQLFDVMGM